MQNINSMYVTSCKIEIRYRYLGSNNNNTKSKIPQKFLSKDGKWDVVSFTDKQCMNNIRYFRAYVKDCLLIIAQQYRDFIFSLNLDLLSDEYEFITEEAIDMVSSVVQAFSSLKYIKKSDKCSVETLENISNILNELNDKNSMNHHRFKLIVNLTWE